MVHISESRIWDFMENVIISTDHQGELFNDNTAPILKCHNLSITLQRMSLCSALDKAL